MKHFLVLIIAALAVTAGCSSHSAAAPTATLTPYSVTASTQDSGGKYDQTWDKEYAATTCADWNASMTEHQRWIAAADMLTSARDKIDGGTGVAPDALVDTFERGITTVCAPGVPQSLTITDAAYGVYHDGSFAP